MKKENYDVRNKEIFQKVSKLVADGERVVDAFKIVSPEYGLDYSFIGKIYYIEKNKTLPGAVPFFSRIKRVQDRNEKIIIDYLKLKQDTGQSDESIACDLEEKYPVSASIIQVAIQKFKKWRKETNLTKNEGVTT